MFCFYRGHSCYTKQHASRQQHGGGVATTGAFPSSVASSAANHQLRTLLHHRPIHSALLREPPFLYIQFSSTFPRNTLKGYCCGNRHRNPPALFCSLPPSQKPQLFHQPNSDVTENGQPRSLHASKHRPFGISAS